MSIPRLRRGDRIRGLPGDSWNQFAEATEHYQRNRRAGLDESGATALRTTETVVLIRNETGVDLDFFAVVGLGDPLITPTENEEEFKLRRAFIGVEPAAEHAGKFAIMAHPVAHVDGSADGQDIGRGVVHGVTQALVKMASLSHTFADVDAGETGHLLSAATGGAQILWREEDAEVDDVVWAYVRLGGGGGGPATAAFAMITAKTGTEPPFRYAAEGATMDADGNWSGGGAEYDDIFNVEEQGSGGQWVNPLLVGDVVLLYPAPGGAAAWVAQRQRYRGTY